MSKAERGVAQPPAFPKLARRPPYKGSPNEHVRPQELLQRIAVIRTPHLKFPRVLETFDSPGPVVRKRIAAQILCLGRPILKHVKNQNQFNFPTAASNGTRQPPLSSRIEGGVVFF